MSQMVRHLASVRASAVAADAAGTEGAAARGAAVAAKASDRVSGHQAIFSLMDSRMSSLTQPASSSGGGGGRSARL